MFDILQKAGRGVKKFMSEKINTCKEILSSAQNRLMILWMYYIHRGA